MTPEERVERVRWLREKARREHLPKYEAALKTDTADMRVAKAAGPQRRPCYRVNLPVCEQQRRRQIIGDALSAKIAQHRKVDRAIASRQPASQRHPRVVDMLEVEPTSIHSSSQKGLHTQHPRLSRSRRDTPSNG
jgi:hypothetical protein